MRKLAEICLMKQNHIKACKNSELRHSLKVPIVKPDTKVAFVLPEISCSSSVRMKLKRYRFLHTQLYHNSIFHQLTLCEKRPFPVRPVKIGQPECDEKSSTHRPADFSPRHCHTAKLHAWSVLSKEFMRKRR